MDFYASVDASARRRFGIYQADEPSSFCAILKENISAQSPDMDRLSSQDWPMSESNWLESVDWMAAWESDEPEMPQEVDAHIDWQDDVTVYFCYEKYNVIETKWSIFKSIGRTFVL